jgi:hypothetical protein
MAVKAKCSAGVLVAASCLSIVAAERLRSQQFNFSFVLISCFYINVAEMPFLLFHGAVS